MVRVLRFLFPALCWSGGLMLGAYVVSRGGLISRPSERWRRVRIP